MPLYEYYCEQCQREITVGMSMSERDKGVARCPQCGGGQLRPLVSTVFAQTSRKS
jgi:putative FmdB family regulatory protein